MAQGCALKPNTNSKFEHVYLDEHFATNATLETDEQIFAISPAMKEYVKVRLDPLISTKAKTRRLISDLFSQTQLDISYQHNANYYPVETFETRVANCMSLTLLSYVLAKEAGLNTRFMNVNVEENWNVFNGITQLNGHVNLEITPAYQPGVIYPLSPNYIIDFLPMLNTKIKSKKPLNKSQIIALFYNNKGADALASGKTDLAYQYFKEATILAPNLASLWGNLASFYRRNGYQDQAETLYKHAINLDSSNLTVKENLALLYKLSDRPTLAIALNRQVKEKRKRNPYYHAMRAEEALFHNDPNAALKLFKKAIKLNSREHSFYFGLARAAIMREEYDRAERFLIKARRLAALNSEKRRYDSKISALSNLVVRAH